MSDAFTLVEPAPRAAAGIAAYRDRAALHAALQSEFGLEPPIAPGFVQSAGIMLSSLAPGRFFATADRGDTLVARLEAALSAYAAITDQGDLWHVFALAGPHAPDVLSRIVPIDLSTTAFPPGALALTRAGHLDVRLWHLAPGTFELATPRSFAADLRHTLHTLLASAAPGK